MKVYTSLKFLSIAIVASLAASAHGSVIFSGSYTQNFDTTIAYAATVPSVFSATIGAQAAIPAGDSSSGWEGTKNAGTGGTATAFTVDNGTSNAGGLFSYGAASSSERALGAVASAGNIMSFGVEFTNNTGAPIDSVAINYTGEFWRSSTSVANTLAFAYALSGGASTSANYLTTASLPSTSLDLVGPAPVTTNGALNGNDSSLNQSARSGVLSGLNWLPGQSLYIRWADANDNGNDAGLAVDNFSMNIVPEPSCLFLMFAAGLALLGLIRRHGR